MATFSEIRTWKDVRRDPLYILLLINTAVFLLMAILWASALLFDFDDTWRRTLLSVPYQPHELLLHPWTVLTYMFTHYNFVHFLINMLWLLWFGQIMEESASGRMLVKTYLLGGIGGAAAYILGMNLINDPTLSAATLCGASASIIAVMAAVAFRTPNYKVRFLFFGEVSIKWIALGSILIFFIGSIDGNLGGLLAHGGGLIAGIILGLTKRRNKSHKPWKARNVKATKKAMQKHADDLQRLDALLDKIKVSGYESLSRSEKKELNEISVRMERKEVAK